jgi:hypothetical protein
MATGTAINWQTFAIVLNVVYLTTKDGGDQPVRRSLDDDDALGAESGAALGVADFTSTRVGGAD